MVPREGFGWMNGTCAAATVFCFEFTLTGHYCAAAYQVGLSYLSTGMRRAVSACTSPEVFFGSAAIPQPISNQLYNSITDPLNLAMETLNLSEAVASPISTTY